MKKGEICLGYVERVDFPGKGIIVTEGEEETATVKRVIPGQTVFFRVRKKRKGKVDGELLSVRDRAHGEITPDCHHFGNCGSCYYRNMLYDDQLRLKEEQIKRILDKVYINRGVEPDYLFEGIYKSHEVTEYRNKMEYSFGDEEKGGPLVCGLHKSNSRYDIVPVTDCKITDRDFRLILSETTKYFREKNMPFYHKMSGEGYLRHLLVRKSHETGEILIAVVTSSDYPKDASLSEKELLEGYKEHFIGLEQYNSIKGSIAGIIHIVNDTSGDVVKCDKKEILYGKDYFYDKVLGLKFKITLFSFFQTNTLGAEVLYDRVRNYANISDETYGTVYDLYCGTGTIAQIMAPVAKKVVGVEIVEEAVEAAKKNAAENKLDNCEFIAGDVLKVLDDLTEKPDLIILDPPRDGVNPKALNKILAMGVDNIIYISCKPTSLARDLDAFFDAGYKVERTCAVDLFPGTVHMETVAALKKTEK